VDVNAAVLSEWTDVGRWRPTLVTERAEYTIPRAFGGGGFRPPRCLLSFSLLLSAYCDADGLSVVAISLHQNVRAVPGKDEK
jgi:hypothetical protein